MNSHKLTLNLPKTKFPMKGNLSTLEIKILKKWYKDNLYQLIRNSKNGKKTFYLHDGPPYANGNIHLGHAVNKILKDIIIKSKNMSGFDAPYTPAWDCHGLPIEHKVENSTEKKIITKISLVEFHNKCKRYAIEQVKNQKQDFIRLGVLGDWENSNLSINFQNEANVVNSLKKIIKKKHIYLGFKPVYWCFNCSSSLSEAEIEYYEKKSPSIIIMFEAVNNHVIYEKFKVKDNITKKINLTAWTTTPWTLPASKAITLHPDCIYQLIKTKNNLLLILSKSSIKSIMKKINVEKWEILSSIKGNKLELIEFFHPFLLNTKLPIILGKHVSTDVGTGAVHTAPDHGQDDYIISQRYGLTLKNIVDNFGNYSKNIHPLLNNLHVLQANIPIIKLLKKHNALLHNSTITHSYPHCWRHKTPVIFRATKQWFISMDQQKLREKVISEIKKVNWIPTWGKKSMHSLVKNRPDWCISRQRTWGVPITLFINKKTEKIHSETVLLMNEIEKYIKLYGIGIWWDDSIYKLLKVDPKKYVKVSDILDVWFESGSTHISKVRQKHNNSNYNNNSPADLYVEGTDQHRGWFMSSLIISTAIRNIAPYAQVLTHGFIIDENGRKMSKSIGNTISPNSIINTLGADILRLWVATTDYSKDMTISNIILKQTTELYRKIRNTARFLLANLDGFNPNKNLVNQNNMLVIDQWAVSKAKHVQDKIIKLYSNYKFHELIQHIIHFCSIEMSSFYLDIIKDRLYTIKKDSIERYSCQTAIYYILHALTRWIAPILSFTSEEIWSYIPGKESKYIFTEEWFDGLFYLSDNNQFNHKYWECILNIKTEVNKVLENARAKKIIRSSLEASISLYVDKSTKKKLTLLEHELKFLFITSETIVKNYNQAPETATISQKFLNLKIDLKKSSGEKCHRCWHYIAHLQENSNFPNICNRCIKNTIGSGEKRKFL